MSNVSVIMPAIEGLNSQDWSTVIDVNSLVEQISDQNERYAEAGEVFEGEPDILTIVYDGIAEEQLETFTNIRELTPEMDRIGAIVVQQNLETESENSSAIQQQEADEAELAAKEAELDELRVLKQQEAESQEADILDKVALLSPKALERVRELLNQRGVSITKDEQIQALEDEMLELMERTETTTDVILSLEKRRTEIAVALSRIARSWELPQALLAEGRSIQVVLDELPVDPKLDTREQELYRELKEHHVDQPEATLYLALYLKEHANEKVTVDDLASFLYKPEVIASLSDKNLRARVTTLLGPVSGSGVRAILESQDMVLQYGWRRTLEQQGGGGRIVTTGRQRIYRALKVEDLQEMDLEGFEESEKYTDEFVVTPELSALTITNHEQIDQSALDDVVSTPTRSIEPRVDAPRRRVEDQIGPDAQKRGVRLTNTDVRQPQVEHEANDWEKEFRVQIGEAITRLAEHGILDTRNGIELRTARAIMQSSIFGSPTNIRRMLRAGQLSRLKNIPPQNYSEQVVTPAEMVVMSIINTTMSILGGGHSKKRQRRALEIVDAAVESYFANQEKAAKENAATDS